MINPPVPSLRGEAIECLAKIVSDRYSASEITDLFRRAGLPQISHDGSTKWRFVAQAFESLQADAKGNPAPILKVVECLCNPQGYLRDPELLQRVHGEVNRALAFYGVSVAPDGSLHRIRPTSTLQPRDSDDALCFDARDFHPQVRMHGRTHFARGAYFHAVFECCKAFDMAVHTNSGNTQHGQPLMSASFSLQGPVKINSQRSQSERDEQEGIKFLAMGLMSAVRNPQAHEPEMYWPMSREDALDVLALLSFLFRKLEKAVVILPGAQGGTPIAF